MGRNHPNAKGARLIERGIPLLILLCAASLGPVYAITVSKLNVTNNYASSTHQKVSVYGLPPLIQSSPASAYTTKVYTGLTYAPYPYATSANTRATYALPAGVSILRTEKASSTLSTVNPSAALTISDWSFWGGTNGGSRLGAVPDPSISRQIGPSEIVPLEDGVIDPNSWISLNITFRNTLKPLHFEEENALEVFKGALDRPSSRIAFMDFGVGARAARETRLQEVAVEEYYSQRSILKVNPNSQGNLAQAFDLFRNSSSGYIANGRSSADDGVSATLFAPPVVPVNLADAPEPSPSEPVTAHVLSASDVVRATFRTISARRILTHATLPPGESVTFQVRVLLGAFDGFGIGTADITPFRPLFISRMREITVENGEEVTECVFSGVTEYSRDIDEPSGSTPQPRPWTVPLPAPLDRQDWAHRLELYNRALAYYGSTTPPGRAPF